MESTRACPECGAVWQGDTTCQDYFHQMLFWENENPANGVVHHLMVLCYHLQHPSLYSPEGLEYSKGLLVDFVEGGLSTEAVRQRSRDQVDSGKRAWKITARPDAHGVYDHPIRWTKTAADVVAAGADNYVDSVRSWAQAVYESLQAG
jgi:hypothetical protein